MRSKWSAADEAAVHLLDEANRIAASAFSTSTSDTRQPGIYAWFVDVEGATHLSEGAADTVLAGLVYAGQAGAGASTATLGSRIRGNHLGGSITGSTFRMTLASLLARRLGLRDEGGRALAGDGEARLTAWMRRHLSVAVVPEPDRDAVVVLEDAVLGRIDPPLNLAGRPATGLRAAVSSRRRRPLGGGPVAQPAAPPASIALVGCVQTKLAGIHPAGDLYRSPLFAARKRFVEARGMPWWILSARHGLVAPSRLLPAYDETLEQKSKAERAEWGQWVVAELRQEVGTLQDQAVEVHAGRIYLSALEGPLEDEHACLRAPAAHMGIGEQLHFYASVAQ